IRRAVDVQAMGNHVHFMAALGIVKAARGDLLVGLHLALGIVRECLALLMTQRDETTSAAASIPDDLQDVIDGCARPLTTFMVASLIRRAVSAWQGLTEYVAPGEAFDSMALDVLFEMLDPPTTS